MFKYLFKALLLGSTLLATSFLSSAESNSNGIHDSWNILVTKNVVAINNGHSTEVDYAAIKLQHSELKSYLDSITAITRNEFDGWNKPKQLAFLINAYNAWTVELIVSNLESKDHPELKSIKELGSFFSSPWSKEFIPLLGKTHSLDDIEHKLIRGSGRYNDPRIHFAVNCASIGCPALRAEAYNADALESQLQDQTIRFLSDKTRNFAKDNTLSLSSIFKWYGEDFEQGFRGASTLSEFMLQYPEALKLIAAQKEALKSGKMNIKFLDYNWALNVHQ
jgi:hypothetical protein